MKHTLKTMMSFVVLFNLLALSLGAQLSGAYTINSALPTGGSNFQSFTAFAATINTAGISAPVSVAVAPGSGPYTEQVIFNQITGASAINTIVINGNSNTLTFNATLVGSPHTFVLNGTDYMTVNDLNMTGTGGTYALVCHLWNQANNNQFNNCVISAPINGTGIQQIPVSVSGSGTSGTTAGNSGNDNVWTNCTMNGGYYNTVFYGNTTTPYNTGNMVINCNIRDFYFYGVYNLYCRNTTVRGNTIERTNRTNASTGYGIYFGTGSVANELIEKNRIQRMFDATQGTSNSMYGIYLTVGATLGSENIIRNNVISNINYSNGLIYGIYGLSNSYCNVYHNTISLDDPSSTAGTTYGIYSSGTAGTNIRNNLVSITRGGTGTKYCLYYTNTSISSNNNGLYMNAPAGLNGIAYYLNAYTTLSNWQGANGSTWDQNSASADPLFTNPAAFNYLPASVPLNNIGTQLGINDDILGVTRYTVAPDPGAFEFFNVSCNNSPAANSVLTPTAIACPNSISNLSLANNYTVNGLTFQWASATNSVGPFVAVPNATNMSLSTPTLANSTWYTVIVTCANGGLPINAVAGQVVIATTVTNTVPYYEGFEGISGPNKLPNCSWAISNGVTCQTYDAPNTQNRVPNTGNKFASFYYLPSGTNYFYTNGIQLYAGVTYSASMFFTTESYGYNTYDLSIMVGPNQSTTGLVPIVNLPYAASGTYKQLNNTFTVSTSGLYYVGIKAISNGVCCGYYLSWDDLSITIPCELNTPVLSISGTPASTLCAGQPVNFTATGADTYTWNTGAVGATISDIPSGNITYVVTGTDAESGCPATVSKNVSLMPSPQVSIYTLDPDVCEGSPITLSGIGATSYTWDTGANTSQITVMPLGTTAYTVIGSNQYGCSNQATQIVNVNALPDVTIVNSPQMSCQGDGITLTGFGAQTYQWTASNLYIQGTQVVVTPYNSTTYTVTGTDVNGCAKTIQFTQTVNICTGLQEVNGMSGLTVYPNPNSGVFSIELRNGLSKTIEVMDVTGRTILTQDKAEDLILVDISGLANGIYYVKIKSDNAAEVLKIVKQ